MFAYVAPRIMLHLLRRRKVLVDRVLWLSSQPPAYKMSLHWVERPLVLSLTIRGPLPRYEWGHPSFLPELLGKATFKELSRRGTRLTVSEMQMRFQR